MQHLSLFITSSNNFRTAPLSRLWPLTASSVLLLCHFPTLKGGIPLGAFFTSSPSSLQDLFWSPQQEISGHAACEFLFLTEMWIPASTNFSDWKPPVSFPWQIFQPHDQWLPSWVPHCAQVALLKPRAENASLSFLRILWMLVNTLIWNCHTITCFKYIFIASYFIPLPWEKKKSEIAPCFSGWMKLSVTAFGNIWF